MGVRWLSALPMMVPVATAADAGDRITLRPAPSSIPTTMPVGSVMSAMTFRDRLRRRPFQRLPCDRRWVGRGAAMAALRVVATLAAAAGLVLSAAPAIAQSDRGMAGEALVETLASGGYSIYFRHAATDWSQDDHVESVDDLSSCDPSRMRQLSESGRATMRRVGEAMRSLAIPVERIHASPYCRTVETAELLGLGPVERSTDIVNLRAASLFGGRGAVVATARALIATAPEPGTNTILSAHGNLAQAATEVYPGEGEAIVFRPSGANRFEFVGRLTPDEWIRLAEQTAGD